MSAVTSIDAVAQWLNANWFQLAITLTICLAYILLDRISAVRIKDNVGQSGFRDPVARKAVRTSRTILAIVGLLVLTVVWGIEVNSVFIFASTTVTLLGVALFANWSLLSNVTAYFLLLVQPQYQRGVFIRVLDADNYVEGFISELTIFNTKLTSADGEIIVYPNNLLLSKLIVVEPKTRLHGVGKLPSPENGGRRNRFARPRSNPKTPVK